MFLKIRAFTLVELMIVIAIIALLAAVGLPSLMNARRKSQIARMANDLRVISGSFEQYAVENNRFPPDGPAPGTPPPGMATYFTKIRFDQDTPLGGKWDWDGGYLATGALSVVGSTSDTQQWQDFDKKIDDGDLGTGAFHNGPGRYIYILEQ